MPQSSDRLRREEQRGERRSISRLSLSLLLISLSLKGLFPGGHNLCMSPQNSNRNNFWVCMSNTEMLEMKGNKKRLPISLSFLTLTDSKKQTSAHKSPRNFEEPNGVVGLGILAAMNDDRHHHQDPICNNGSRTAVLAISPKSASNPIPILRNKNASENKTNEKLMSVEKMEFCEEYTCVISHVGKNLVEKREYFEADILGNRGCPAAILVSPVSSGGGETAAFRTADFLSSCFLCQKMLQGLDVFMYRGDKAFCSAECRYRQICIDEQKEKRRSGARKSMAMVKFSVSPCSVAAA